MASTSPNPNKSPTGDTETLSLLDLVRERLNHGVLVLDARGHLLNFTGAVPTLLGWPAEKPGPDFQADFPPPLDGLLRRCLGEGVSACLQEILLPRAGKNPRKLEVSAVPVGAGDALMLVVSLNDRGTAEQVLRRVEQMDRLASVGTMSAGVCHEIKNALVPVKTLVDLLLKQNRDAEMAGLVSRELRRIDALVSQMLRFAGPSRPVFATFHLHEVLHHTLQLVERQAAQRKVAITRDFSAAIDLVRGDHYQVQQAFLNLFLNALEAMPSGGHLSIATAFKEAPGLASPQTPAMLTATVRDTGCGIAPENLTRLFEPFFTTKSEGNGLGLAITQRILREHAGEITVDSVPGQGTVFAISLPGADTGH